MTEFATHSNHTLVRTLVCNVLLLHTSQQQCLCSGYSRSPRSLTRGLITNSVIGFYEGVCLLEPYSCYYSRLHCTLVIDFTVGMFIFRLLLVTKVTDKRTHHKLRLQRAAVDAKSRTVISHIKYTGWQYFIGIILYYMTIEW